MEDSAKFFCGREFGDLGGRSASLGTTLLTRRAHGIMADEKDPLGVVADYWREVVHERDLREMKWPRDSASVTHKWLSATLESEVEDFRFVDVGTPEAVRSIRLKVKHRDAEQQQQQQRQQQQESKRGSLALDFPSENPAVRRLWARAYRNVVAFRREFAGRNPTSAKTLAANLDPLQPGQFCVVSEDTLASDDVLEFPDWVSKGMNAHFAQLMYASAARGHGAFFANPAVEKQLRIGGGVGLRPSGRYAPAFAHVLGAFFAPTAAGVELCTGAGERFRDMPLREVYAALAPKGRQHPVPALFGPRGREIAERCLDAFHRRPLTLCHGELHPGHAHMNVVTNEFTFGGGWRLVSAAPPGSDLSVGILTALQPCTRAQMRGIVNTYYAALVAAAAGTDIASVYSADDCWEDFLVGCLLWCCTAPVLELEELVGAAAEAAATAAGSVTNALALSSSSSSSSRARGYLPLVHARVLRTAAELDLEGFAQALLSGDGSTAAAAAAVAADSISPKRKGPPRSPMVRPAPKEEQAGPEQPEPPEQARSPVAVPFT